VSGPRLIHVTTVDLSLYALLANQLRQFAAAGFEVSGASAPGPYVEALEEAGIRHLAVSSLTRSWTPAKDARALAELRRLFRAERPDIVHTHNPKSGVLGRVAARAAGVPIVVNTVHGLYAHPRLPPVRRVLIGTAERLASRFSHHELFQSREDYELAIQSGMVPAVRATWLGNGVDVRRFSPPAVDEAAVAGLRRAWGAAPDTFVVGTVGRLVREKGYEDLFEAVRLVRAERADVVFVAVGPKEPSKADCLGPEALAKGREAGVVFHGAARDMPPIYAAFDLFVLPSHREGVPRSAIEASAMARPVVATAIRGSREVVADGVTGLLVPVRDPRALAAAITSLIGNPERVRRMGEAARARAESRFDEDQVVRRSLEVYRRLLREQGRAG
jgi:glycosyltransferase involved in cell wall biosynthesis